MALPTKKSSRGMLALVKSEVTIVSVPVPNGKSVTTLTSVVVVGALIARIVTNPAFSGTSME